MRYIIYYTASVGCLSKVNDVNPIVSLWSERHTPSRAYKSKGIKDSLAFWIPRIGMILGTRHWILVRFLELDSGFLRQNFS